MNKKGIVIVALFFVSIFIKGLIKTGDEYSKGEILDPKNGKLYKCFITLEEKDKLKVRGFIGISLFERSQFGIG